MASRWIRAGAVAVCGVGAWAATAQPPGTQPASTQLPVSAGQRPVAYIYGTELVTREQLGEFLIARGGHEKVELLVNKIIIERECAAKGVVVTPQMMEAALNDDLKGLGPNITKDDFVKHLLPRYGKTFYEWMEDVIKPRLQLTELIRRSKVVGPDGNERDRVVVTDEDLKIQFEHEYGEQRMIQIIMYPPSDDPKGILAAYGKLRESQDEFDRAAKQQANPSLAASLGNIQPVRRHSTGDDKVVEREAFKLKEGEISGVIQLGGANADGHSERGWMVMKLHKIIPANPTKSFEKEKDSLYKDAYAKQLEKEIPAYFKELKDKAAPNVLLKGPPSEWQVRNAARALAEDVARGMGPVQATGGSLPAPGGDKK
jgi:PPIC-type PPIASE domain